MNKLINYKMAEYVFIVGIVGLSLIGVSLISVVIFAYCFHVPLRPRPTVVPQPLIVLID
jgi:hypothetical protein